jgi:lipopolysaccharide export system protein LptA
MTRMPRICRRAAALIVVALVSTPAFAQSTDVFMGFSSDSKAPIQVDAATLEVFEQDNQRISLFTGGVTVHRGDTTMKAATIKLYSDKGGDQNGFTRMEASGTVYVNSGNQTATGSNAVVDNKAQTITMTGNVVLSKGEDVVTGARLVIDMATGRARVDPMPGKRVNILISPNAKNSDATDKTPGAGKPGADQKSPN